MSSSRYEEVYRRWQESPEDFWAEAAERIHWFRRWDTVLDQSRPPFARWFAGGMCNTCHDAVDRWVERGHGDRKAVIWDSPITESQRTLTYAELRDEVALLAGALKRDGVERGDRVLIYMPMIPEAVVAMLACARIGAVHSVVFGGFAAAELSKRIDDAAPSAVVSASCGIEPARVVPYLPLLQDAIESSAHPPGSVVVLDRPEHPSRPEQLDALAADGRKVALWPDYLDGARPADCVPVQATDPLYVLYTSGTTGKPKGVVRDHGGHMVALDWSMDNVYGVESGEVYWAASDIGWVVGHSYIVYAPLLHGCTTILYEGKPVGTPDAGAFWRVIAEHGVSTLFTAPTAFRAIKRDDPRGALIADHDLSAFRALFLAGERADPDTLLWAETHLGVPVIDHWWQTETGWPIVANCLGLGQLPVKHGSPTKPVPGYELEVLDADRRPVERGKIGSIVLRLPLPPGCLPTLWHDDEAYVQSYLEDFPGFYKTGDAGFVDEDGYVYIMSRTDDLINVAGHRLSTGGMEEVLCDHPDVAEAAVLGVADGLKGQVPLGLVVLNAGVDRPEAEIVGELVQAVRDRIGPVASFKIAAVVERLPKTRSGKVLRGTMHKMADGETWAMPATIDDPAILDEIEVVFEELGYPKESRS